MDPNWRPPLRAGESYGTGAYHFVTLCTDGAKQARHFLRVAPPNPAALARAARTRYVHGRTRLVATSLVDSFEARDAVIASGMSDGIRQGYERLDELLAG